jgi:hypothetical protein
MDIVIFSDSKKIDDLFSRVKNKQYSFHYFPVSELKKTIKNIESGTLLYIDVTNVEESERDKILKFLSKLKGYHYGIIDPRGTVDDIAEQFHNGACDYIGKGLIKEGISPSRLKKIVELVTINAAAGAGPEGDEVPANRYILSGNNWDEIKPGNEYTFCFMFIELDNQKELVKKFGAAHIDSFLRSFHDLIERIVSPINGRIWMPLDFGALILIPFDGKKCDAILTSFRFIMARKIISIEEYDSKTLLSYRIALHLGNTIYKSRGETGTIISESINSVFHLGQKFTEPGNFYLTKEIFPYIPHGLKKWFIPVGKYEGRDIMRMILPY